MKTLGQIGYEAYGEDSGWKAFDGRPMPRWADLRPDIANRWEVAASAIQAGFMTQVYDQWKSRQRPSVGLQVDTLPEGAQPYYYSDAEPKSELCIQCQHPDYDGICTCGNLVPESETTFYPCISCGSLEGVCICGPSCRCDAHIAIRRRKCAQCANPDLKGLHTCGLW